MLNEPDEHQEIRDAVRHLCSQFPDEYFRKVDEQRGYPETFVDALMEAGWLAAMIPEEYGGTGLGLTAASVIMEEINRSRRQLRCRARPDVQHGHAAAQRQQGAEGQVPARSSRQASCASSRWP